LLDELIIVGGKMVDANVTITLWVQCPNHIRVVMVQTCWVGTFHETLSLLLEEETKKMWNYTKGKNLHCIVKIME
jgi:hypothetical protein